MSAAICRIITDSCCDLPRDLLAAADVEVLHFPFILSDGEHRDDLGVSMSHEKFYALIDGGELPSTAQIPIPDLESAFTAAAESGIPTVYLSFSSGLSGTFGTAEMIGESVRATHPGAELYIIDTSLASIAEGLLVLEALRMRDEGISAREIAGWAGEACYLVHGYFILDGLDHLSRGGRLPDIAAAAGAKLDVKPMLRFGTNGKLAFEKLVRGRKKSIRSLSEMLGLLSGDATPVVIIASAAAEPDADRLEELVSQLAPHARIVRSSIGPVIGSHVGPGMVALAFWGPDRREGSFAQAVAAVDAAKGAASAATDAAMDRAKASASAAKDAASSAMEAASAATVAFRSRFGRSDD